MINTVGPQIQNQQNKPANLKIFYINDLHGQVDNFGRILAASKQFDLSTKNTGSDTLKLSAGDNFAGGDPKKNGLVLSLLNFMNFDASAVGNHELDGGAQMFLNLTKNLKTKFLAANMNYDGKNPIQTGVQKSYIKEMNGNKYGVIGLIPLDLKTVASKKEQVEGIDPASFEQTVADIQSEVQKLHAQGINKIILASHVGKDVDEKLAPQLSGVDIIVGGHSHNVIEGVQPGKNLVASATGEPVLILQTGENAKNYGILDVNFDANGILTEVSNNVVPTDQKKSPIIEYISDNTIGKSPQVGTVKKIDPIPLNRRTEPCAWTAFICDALRSEFNVDIAFVNSANTRKVPKEGKLTERDIIESTPMKNTLLTTQLSESQIVNAVSMAAKRSLGHATGEPGLLQASGINYTVNDTGKLLNMNFVDKSGKETPIDINNPSQTKLYTVAYDSFVADGREYPEMIPDKPINKFEKDKDKVTIDYLKKRPDKDSLIITDDGRLKIIQTLKPQQSSYNTQSFLKLTAPKVA